MVDVSKDAKTMRRAAEVVTRENTALLANKLPTLTRHQLADFIVDNFEALERYTQNKMDIDQALDILREGHDPQTVKNTMVGIRPLLKNFIYKTGYSNLQIQNVPFDFQDARKVGERTIARRTREKKQRAEDWRTITAGTLLFGEGASDLSKSAYLAVRGLSKNISGVAKLVMGSGNLLFNRRVWNSAMAGVIGSVGIYGTADAKISDYPILRDTTSRIAFHQACTPDVLTSNSPVIASFAVNFGSQADPVRYHAYLTAMEGAKHGVPPQALYLISHFETGGFRDVVANNSSASNLFQFIDDTKINYLKVYGQQTQLYIDAKKRISAGTSTNNDKLVVLAIDTVHKASLAGLRDALKKKTISGPVYDGLRLADTSTMAAELVSLDLIKKMPAIADENISPTEVLDLIADYYARDHFLGHGNYKRIMQQASTDNAVSLYVAQPKLKNVILGNPGLLDTKMTAGESLAAIKSNFIRRVQGPFKEFVKAYDARKGVHDYCITDPSDKALLAQTMPRYRATALAYGTWAQKSLPGLYDMLSAKFGTVHDNAAVSLPNDGLSKSPALVDVTLPARAPSPQRRPTI